MIMIGDASDTGAANAVSDAGVVVGTLNGASMRWHDDNGNGIADPAEIITFEGNNKKIINLSLPFERVRQ